MPLNIPDLARFAFREEDIQKRVSRLCVATGVPSDIILKSEATDAKDLAVELMMWKLNAAPEDAFQGEIESHIVFTMGPDPDTWKEDFAETMFENAVIPHAVSRRLFQDMWDATGGPETDAAQDAFFSGFVSYRKAHPLKVCVRAIAEDEESGDPEALTCLPGDDLEALAAKAAFVAMDQKPRDAAESWLLASGWRADFVSLVPAEVHDLPGVRLAIYETVGRVERYDEEAEADAFARECGYTDYVPSDVSLMERVLSPLVWERTEPGVWEGKVKGNTLYTISREAEGFRVPTADPDSEYAHTNTLEFARACVAAHYKRTAFRSLSEEALTVLREAFPK